MEIKIFYSWQSDLPNRTNRSFIERALNKAVKKIRDDESISVEPVIDRDTFGVPGSPNIAETILEKIDNCHIFIGDVSIINMHSKKRKTPNPNVMIELGYALKRLNFNRIIMILNKAYGKPEELPFDLKMKRAVHYSAPDDLENLDDERKSLSNKLESALKIIIEEIESSKPDLANEKNFEDSHLELNYTLDITKFEGDALENYNNALKIASDDNIIGWRKIIREAKEPLNNHLITWRDKWEPNPPFNGPYNDVTDCILDGISAYAPLFGISLAGVVSEHQKFSNQTSILNDILFLKKRIGGGYVSIVDFPRTIAFIYRALHGAVCLQTSQLDLAINLSKTRIAIDNNKSSPLFKDSQLIAMPDMFQGHGNHGWRFLLELPEHWSWLVEIFGDRTDFHISLCAYYLGLNVLELADCLSSGNEEILTSDKIHFDIPLFYLLDGDKDIERQAYSLFKTDFEQVKNIWRKSNVDDLKIRELWASWINHTEKWIVSWPRWNYPGVDIIHKDLIEDIF